ncbi:MAG: leucine-rich repeat domain-containing protein [Prevotellaceae bacterium]|jgi:hypothetical protein|nr:leucine-rich repeat domain-containing protein [Prevotellaceae bacterium]
MIKIKQILIAVCLLATTTTTWAQTWQIGYPNAEDVTATLSDGTLTINGIGEMSNIGDMSVDVPWRDYRNQITVVDIADAITGSIADYAFQNATNLEWFFNGNGIQRIGNNAFQNCTNLAYIRIPESVISIGNRAFSGCSAAESIYLGNIQTIGDNAFLGCINLTYIQIPSSVTSIGQRAFQACETSVESELTKTCGSKLESVYFGIGVTHIPYQAFRYCDKLTQVHFHPFVQSIGERAFQHCSNLAWISMPEGLTTIERGAFQNTAVGILSIPSTVTSIGDHAFADCRDLTTVLLHNPVPLNISEYVFNGLTLADIILSVPECTGDVYGNAPIWQGFNIINQGDCESSSINNVTNTARTIIAFYTPMGIKLQNEPTNGVYIVVFDDGSTEKRVR